MNRPERMDTATEDAMLELGRRARAAAHLLSLASPEAKNNALIAAAEALRAATPEILAANVKDIEAARAAGRPESFIDRLLLNEKRINAMADGVAEIAKLADPIGTVLAEWQRPNGLRFQRVRVPLGVIGIIYESRPNVTADAGALALKAGNAAILRGGSESIHSSRVIHAALVAGLKAAGLPEAAISLVPTPDRAAVGMMLTGLNGTVDVIVPRGGKSLVERVQNEARVPVFAHLEGLCHTYVDRNANLAMAVDIVLNAKMRRTGVCGATETLLVDSGAPAAFMPTLVKALLDAGCEVRGDSATQQADARVKPAADADWSTEYLDAIISAREVDGIDGALAHIARYSTQHTDAIVTNDADTAARFQREVDSAIVVHNASTQFADGGEFGFGGEIGIATGKMHARGPVGVEQLTSFKYVVIGNGQTRPS
ncbi:glutamate-5-semialdehyde dehydrogenase [Hyphomicrobium sp. D-2]|uniref:glutamate-5-semialdehyde dehydrogenase n=1 Tax=Hyphomicrobium sp. D-2 TaxID=3041621 RepID=UPI002457673D|nr:glutamate-5-semialdehyde dehydrogenase [Hyphomicrobium sp. D-2]MDH4983686.1 glutamate-5-semialdehyde dehydrogenase [Hyphomicrobium sp. D-2]